MEEVPKKEAQNDAISLISKRIWDNSKKFDCDTQGKKSMMDTLIEETVVGKSLESDELLFIEGMRPKDQPNFVSRTEVINDLRDHENWENISAGDHEEGFEEKIEEINERQREEIGWFEKNAYFQKLFPSLHIQKPGVDLYSA